MSDQVKRSMRCNWIESVRSQEQGRCTSRRSLQLRELGHAARAARDLLRQSDRRRKGFVAREAEDGRIVPDRRLTPVLFPKQVSGSVDTQFGREFPPQEPTLAAPFAQVSSKGFRALPIGCLSNPLEFQRHAR